jgi:hypothetical protein
MLRVAAQQQEVRHRRKDVCPRLMHGHHDGNTRVTQVFENRHDTLCARGVKASCRFVDEKDRGSREEFRSYAEPALFPTGNSANESIADAAVRALLEAKLVQQALHGCLNVGRAGISAQAQLRVEAQVLRHRAGTCNMDVL